MLQACRSANILQPVWREKRRDKCFLHEMPRAWRRVNRKDNVAARALRAIKKYVAIDSARNEYRGNFDITIKYII